MAKIKPDLCQIQRIRSVWALTSSLARSDVKRWLFGMPAKLIRCRLAFLTERYMVGKTPSEIQATRPNEYGVFKPHIFSCKVYQAVRLQKFFNYLAMKQIEKRKGVPDHPKDMENPFP